MRRYKCTCRRRWTTLEMMADDGGKHGKVKHFLRQRHNAELIRQQALEGLRLDLDLALTRFSHACAS
jgi:hypothetical protein